MRNIILIVFLLLKIGDGAKILIYSPNYCSSHTMLNGKYADFLAKNGHDVTMFIPEYDITNKMNGTKLAKVIRLSGVGEPFGNLNDVMFSSTEQIPDMADIWSRQKFEDAALAACRNIILKKDELEVLKDYKFDLAYTEMLDLCGIGIVHYLGIKNHIWISTTPLHDVVSYNLGAPAPPSYVPSVEENYTGPQMSLWERLINLKLYLTQLTLHIVNTERLTSIFRKHVAPDFPNLRALASKSALAFVNSDEMLDIPRPILSKIIYIGGLGIPKTNLLDDHWNTIFNKGKKGVVLFCMGTVASFSNFEQNVKIEFLNALNNHKDFHFVIKIDGSDESSQLLTSKYDHVTVATWLPQVDMLAHPKLKLFVGHGGINGLIEAATHGIPMLVLPSFADQQRNAKLVEWRGLGASILRSKINYQSINDALTTILYDESYKKRATRISKLMREKPFTAEERFLKWTNFVIENDGLEELNVIGADLNLIVYFNIDIIILTFTLLLVFLWVTLKSYTFIYKKLAISKTKPKLE
uniref:UDP-glucuronosyltransferase n=1 Tax=Rhabditophanes sp. KR3021 TaxID=114890 RepID=A0AC35U8D6_9BILA